MILIIDSGSTKCRWTALTATAEESYSSAGFNPALMSAEEIVQAFTAAAPAPLRGAECDTVWIYAAGCRSQREAEALRSAALTLWPGADVHAGSDMLGAARAVCGAEPGIACILGTGSNCAIYSPDCGIIDATPPLGYVLGDEGSGADIGKAIVNHVLKRRWPDSLAGAFLTDLALSTDVIINKVYRCAGPNKFLASLTHWAAANISTPQVQELITGRFRAFISANIAPLHPNPGLRAGFVGSVAATFEPQLREAARLEALTVGRIIKEPQCGLISYHRSQNF